MIETRLPGVTLRNVMRYDGAYLRDLINWADGVDQTWANEQRKDGRGFYHDDSPELAGRRPIIEGTYFNLDGGPDGLRDFRRSVMSLYALGEVPLEVEDNGHTLWTPVKVDGKITFDVYSEFGIADFTIPLVAEDPLLYGPLQTPSTGIPLSGTGVSSPLANPFADGEPGDPARVELTNTGIYPAPVKIRVSGGLSEGFEAVAIEKGKRVRFERFIPDGSFVTVDQQTGQAFLDDVSPVGGLLTAAEWFEVDPGETITVQFFPLGVVTGSPRMTLEFAPAEI